MSKSIIIVALAVLIALGGLYWLVGRSADNQPLRESEDTSGIPVTESMQFSFQNPKKSAHYESNTPAHASVLALPPINVVVDFNFDLSRPSAISITSNGLEYGVGETIIDTNRLSMRRAMREDAPDGKYRASYNACWPDGSCHDGHFEFAIDRSLGADYNDMTGMAEAVIRMSEIKFKPANLKISLGTKVTWINDEAVEHYVNTDAHPAHTYYPEQNSRALGLGESYSVIFDQPGSYPYHCSAHADVMVGRIIVE